MKPLIVCDDQIPGAHEVFARVGQVSAIPAADMKPRYLRHADGLIVRSVTRVDAALLAGTRVQLVGTVTSGIDHVDVSYLHRKKIGLIAAAGANAEAVAEYVLAALLVISQRLNFNLSKKTVGIIGAGHVGTIVDRKCRVLGMRTILNDPPLARATGDPRYRPQSEVFQADIVTLHVPLTRRGRYATYHMVNHHFLERLKPATVLINTSRGAVLDESTLKQGTTRKAIAALVIDVWPNEPRVPLDLLKRADIATPHIAGYSLEGKLRALAMVYRGFCFHFRIASDPAIENILFPPEKKTIINIAAREPEDAIRSTVLRVYDPRIDDRLLRQIARCPAHQHEGFFEKLRATYRARHEFGHFHVVLKYGTPALKNKLEKLGFFVSSGRWLTKRQG